MPRLQASSAGRVSESGQSQGSQGSQGLEESQGSPDLSQEIISSLSGIQSAFDGPKRACPKESVVKASRSEARVSEVGIPCGGFEAVVDHLKAAS